MSRCAVVRHSWRSYQQRADLRWRTVLFFPSTLCSFASVLSFDLSSLSEGRADRFACV